MFKKNIQFSLADHKQQHLTEMLVKPFVLVTLGRAVTLTPAQSLIFTLTLT